MSKVDFQIGQVVDARNRLWRIERIITKKSEFEEDTDINEKGILKFLVLDEIHTYNGKGENF